MFNFNPLFETLPQSVPFVGPEALERKRHRAFAARIGANENVFGPSPKAIEAMQNSVSGSWQYGDPENYELREVLAESLDVPAAHIAIGEGIDGLLGYLVRMIVKQGDKVVTSHGAYPTFNYHVIGYGGNLITVPYVDDHENLELLLEKTIETKPALVYLANPDNPMGTWNLGKSIENFVKQLPIETLLVLDEAYIEFAPTDAITKVDVNDPRVIRFRTFSKAHGMAGMRIGYAIGCEELIRGFNRVRNHFGMCRISQIGAIASLLDTDNIADVIRKADESKGRIYRLAESNNLKAIPSAANFVAVDGGYDGQFARMLLEELIQRDIFVRMPFVAPQDRCVRISVGTQQDHVLLEEVFPEALSVATQKYLDATT